MSEQTSSGATGLLSLAQRKQYAQLFVSLDVNADGWMSRAECARWIREQDRQQSDRQIESVFRMIDINVDGKITLDEFFRIMELVHHPPTKNSEAEQQFKKMDRNRDGFLTEDELYDGLRRSGYSMTRKQVRHFVHNFDKNKDGKLSYEEFLMSFS